jgi:hypothetical protein
MSLLSFYFFYHSIEKNFLLKDFPNQIFLFSFRFGIFFWQKFGSKKVPNLKIILPKNYLAEKAENFISVSRVHDGKNKKWLVKISIGC